jgi:hypothetical protein
MILVAGLAVAGLAGIAAAFYFSIRSGSSRARFTGPRRAGAGRLDASRTSPSGRVRPARTMNPSRSAEPSRQAPDWTAGFDAPAGPPHEPGRLVAGRRTRPAAPTSLVAAADVPAEEFEAPADPAAEAGTARSRRRVGWRKGEDVDRELWPAEAFGGVSDEQFWDDMAADKPLATTARTAQPGSGGRRRLPEVAAPADRQAGRGDGRAPGHGRRTAGETAGSYPLPRAGAADQTAVQPFHAVTGPAPMATQPYPVATQPSPSAAQPVQAAAQPVRTAAQPVRAAAQPVRAAAQPVRAARPPAADDDPLTSPAYSLRRQGSVDGHSRLPQAAARHSNGRPDGYLPGGRPDPMRPDPLRPDPVRPDPVRPDGTWPGAAATIPARSWPGSGPDGTHGSAVVRPYAAQRYGEPTQPAQPAGPGRAVSPGDDPRRPDGQWGNGRPAGNGTWGAHAAHPTRRVYPPVNGYGGPYDPGGNDRR